MADGQPEEEGKISIEVGWEGAYPPLVPGQLEEAGEGESRWEAVDGAEEGEPDGVVRPLFAA